MEEVSPFVWVKMRDREPPCGKAVAVLTYGGIFGSAVMACDECGDFHGDFYNQEWDFVPNDEVKEWMDEGLRE